MPIWEHVGHALADASSNLRVGKLDCTRFTSVASRLRISAYPTIIFFRNGVQIPYDGERSKEALVQFALKSAGPKVGTIESGAAFNKVCLLFFIHKRNYCFKIRLSSSKDPVFVYINANNSSTSLRDEYTQVADELFTETRFYQSAKQYVPSLISLPYSPDVSAIF